MRLKRVIHLNRIISKKELEKDPRLVQLESTANLNIENTEQNAEMIKTYKKHLEILRLNQENEEYTNLLNQYKL